MTTDNSSLIEFLITYNMPSGTTKHCKCTEPESRQTVSFFLFIFFRWAGSLYTEQHMHWLIAFSKHWSLTKWFKLITEAWVQLRCSFLHLYAWAQSNCYSTHCIKVQIDSFIWWEVSQEMHFSCYADTTTTLAWFSKYSRFNITNSVPNNSCFSFALCISAAGMEDQIMYG